MRPDGRSRSGVMFAEKQICPLIDQNTELNRRLHFQNRFSGYKIAERLLEAEDRAMNAEMRERELTKKIIEMSNQLK